MTTNISALFGIDKNASKGQWKSQTFTASGIWKRPAKVEVAKVILVAGGGSGAVSRYLNGTNGGNSSFGDILFAEGGKRGLNYNYNKYNNNPEYNGIPGGIGAGFPTAYTYTINTNLNPNFNPSFEGTSALLYNTKNTVPDGILGISSAFGSTGGGGGLSGGNGGNVIGFGKGGSFSLGTGGGGGASYGNGGNGGNPTAFDGVFGGGGGGASGGGGGGGGEIVCREIPVSADMVVIVGAGAPKAVYADPYNPSRSGTSGGGGNGLCIVFWQE